jgi:orotate phosphoribosyltransferase-like protein
MAEQDHRPPQALEAIEWEKKCWALRVQGYTYEQIAKELGLGTRTAAWHAVKKAFDRYREEIREDAFHYIQQQNDQIDMLMQVYFPIGVSPSGALCQ